MITSWKDAVDAFDDLLNEDPLVCVAGYKFLPARVLREVDPIAYRCEMLDWLDSQDVNTDTFNDLYPY